jgi:GDP-L-fucose synthase
VVVPELSGYDLLQQVDVRRLYRDSEPDVVLHLAEQVGGIGANRRNPGRFFYAHLIMGALLIEEARLAGVGKFVQMGTICSYPKYTQIPFREEDLWGGYPDDTSAAYGIAKKALLVQLQAYREQYGFCGIYLLPVNLYGPGDDFDLERSYVIPALIRKMADARREEQPTVEIWGSGEASREFLYVDDCARAILLAAEHYEGIDPVNLGTGSEIKIRDLAMQIAGLVGYGGELRFDRTRPEGQPRRCLDVRKAHQLFGFKAHVSLESGLQETIRWLQEREVESVA